MNLPLRRNFQMPERHQERFFIRKNKSKKLIGFDDRTLTEAYIVQNILHSPEKETTLFITARSMEGSLRVAIKKKIRNSGEPGLGGKIVLLSTCCETAVDFGNMEDDETDVLRTIVGFIMEHVEALIVTKSKTLLIRTRMGTDDDGF